MDKPIRLAPIDERKFGPIQSPWAHLIVMGLDLAGPATLYEIGEEFCVSPLDLLLHVEELIELDYVAV